MLLVVAVFMQELLLRHESCTSECRSAPKSVNRINSGAQFAAR